MRTIFKPRCAMAMMSALGQANVSHSLTSAGLDVLRAAKLVAASGGRLDKARQLATQIAPGRIYDLIDQGWIGTNVKAAVPALGLSDTLAWYREFSEGFFGSMAAFSALARMYTAGDLYAVPPRTLIPILTAAPAGDTSAEGFAKAVSLASFTTGKLEPTRATSMIAFTNELARSISPAAQSMFNTETTRAASIEVDKHFLTLMANTPGAASVPSTGVTASQVLSDLTARVQAMTIGADSRLWFIVSPKLFKTLSLLQGTGGYLMVNNKIGQINIAPSDGATTIATLLDARQIATALESATVAVSGSASIELDDNPTATDYHLFSAFQMNAVIVRSEIWYAALAMRSTAVTFLTGYS
jgi:hypothetical protein